MKKILLGFISCIFSFSLYAVSYSNNTYQKLAQEYTLKAQKAFDAGQYDMAEDYSKKAEENAALSQAFIDKMIAKYDADTQMKVAADKLAWAKNIHADANFPMAYTAGTAAYESAQNSYNTEDYSGASSYAKSVLAALDGVHEITPLPEYYIVRPWADNKDCYWNISGKPFVYNNPLLWENLYQANKANMPDAKNPNLIVPGMKMTIPSIHGEIREGTYDPSVLYEPFSLAR